jgi:hypothetical protein
MKWVWILIALAGCQKSAGPSVKGTPIVSRDAAAADAARDAISANWDGAPNAMCCVIPRVLTGLEKYDPNYALPYQNVMAKGTKQQQANATCNQLSTWPEPTRPPTSNPTQAQIDQYMADFKAGPNISISLPCWDPSKKGTSHGHWTCGGDGGQGAQCMNNGMSCTAGSQCWFDPGATNGIGCTGVVTPCYNPTN